VNDQGVSLFYLAAGALLFLLAVCCCIGPIIH
jgi:hypothetical protein